MLATIALIGRPNVGKSTLFNKLVKRNKAITHDQPGVTRDRIYDVVRPKTGGRPFALVDTGGLVPGGDGDFEQDILEQATEAIDEAQAVMLVVDAREGLTPVDETVARELRQGGKPVLLVVNKVDGAEQETFASDFMKLGFNPVSISASHGYGFNTLMDSLEDFLEENGVESREEEYDPEKMGLRIAMIGRPNAGKSSIINASLGERRLIVSDQAGTTRDSVDVSFDRKGKRYTFVDTAGVRRRGKVVDSLERFSVLKSLKASKKSQVTVLVLDGTQTLSHQDKKLIAFLDREKTPFIVAVNKIDQIPNDRLAELKEHFAYELKIVNHVPVIYTSAVTKAGLGALLPLADRLHKECGVRLGTGELNRVMEEAISRHQPPVIKRRRAKFYYLTQADTEPPTFVFFVNNAELVLASYQRYLENQLRKLVGLKMAPLLVRFKSTHKKREKKKGKTPKALAKGQKKMVSKKMSNQPKKKASKK